MPDVTIAGHRLEYHHTPPPEPGGATIVFLHEGLGSLAQWRRFPGDVAHRSGCGVLAFSRWGYGRSDPRPRPWPISFLHDEAADTLPALLRHFDLERAILYGHSDGGSIALIAAALTPNLIRGAVTEAAHVMIEDVTVQGITNAVGEYRAGPLRARLTRQHGANTEALFAGWTGVWQHPEARQWDLLPLLPRIVCPVLAIQGTLDDFGTAAQVDAIAAGVSGPADTWLIEGCGHAPHRERAAAVAERAASFIERIVRPQRQPQRRASA